MNTLRITLFGFACALALNGIAQTNTSSGSTIYPTSYQVVGPLASFDAAVHSEYDNKEETSPFHSGTYTPGNASDPIIQEVMGSRSTKLPQTSFDGQTGVAPPDPTGAAGPNHYMQAVNFTFQVFSKSGAELTQPVIAGNLWPNDTLAYGSDPVIIYDRHADRWFISQIGIASNFAWFSMRVAVSQTNDPTGLYYSYSYPFSYLPDYPKFGVWWDGYYMMSSTFQSGDNLCVFERDLMLVGDPNARMLTTDLSGYFGLPSNADGSLPPNGTPCYLFSNDFDEFGGADQIVVHEITTDWSGPGLVQYNLTQSIPVAPVVVGNDPTQSVFQPQSLQMLDGLEGYPFIRAQHLRWPTHNSIVLTVTVRDNENDLAIRWYELRDALDGVWSVYQQGTYSPGIGHRWFGSAAMDENGNIALAYSYCHASSGMFPSLRYTGRLSSDPLDTMTFTEQTIIDGLGSQSGTSRYGDYSHMSLDPDGERLWFTGEYLGVNGEVRTRICAINLSAEAGVMENTSFVKDAMVLSFSDNQAVLNVTIHGVHQDLKVELINFQGAVLSESTARSNPEGDAIARFNLNSIRKGVYFVRGLKDGRQIVKRIVY